LKRSLIFQKVKKIFHKYEFWLVFAGTVLFGLIFYFNPFTREFGIIVLTEVGSIWFTVLLINRIIDKRERKRRVAIDQRILSETLAIVASFFSIWKHLTWKYHPQAVIKNEKDFVELYPRLIESCKLSDKFELVSTHYPESWNLFFHDITIRDCFKNYNETLQSSIKSLIDNFKIHMEPELLGSLLEITESQFLREVTSVYDSTETEFVLTEFGKDINQLNSFISDNTNILARMFGLNSYCEYMIGRISNYTDQTFKPYKIAEYFRDPTKYV
jgi:hypothetical protein